MSESERLECESKVELASRIRSRLGPAPKLAAQALVSIVVLNRNGAPHLRRLLSGLVERTDYPRLELILVDNGSSDESLELVRAARTPFPITTLANDGNESFSHASIQGADAASGELLLFLNNDIEPFEAGWLRELVECHRQPEVGAAAATLLCPEEEQAASFAHGYGVQHRGLSFRKDEDKLTPELRGWEDDPLDQALGKDVECDAVAAACMLVASSTFRGVGGFSDGYFYGCEDVDFSLKLRAAGLAVVCSGRSLAIHHPASTRRAIPFEEAHRLKLANHQLLWERWGARVRQEEKLNRKVSACEP